MSNQKITQNKQLKIYSRYQSRQNTGVVLPEIRLSGKWLKQLGFGCGQSITIIHKQNKILIVKSKTQA